MKENELEELYNHIVFDLDTIRIEQTSIDEPEKSYELLKLLKEIKDNINERFNNVRHLNEK